MTLIRDVVRRPNLLYSIQAYISPPFLSPEIYSFAATSSKPLSSLPQDCSIKPCLGRFIKARFGSWKPLIYIMRLSPYPRTRLSSVFFLIPSLAIAISLDCSDARDDGVSFNFKPLDGPHSFYRIKEHPNGIINTTFTIDICRPLERQKGVPKGEDCPGHTRGRPIP